MTADPIRARLDAVATALRHLHSALLDVAKSDYEFMHGAITSPYTLFNLVTSDPAFQWLRPLSGLMTTLDEVIDQKNSVLTERQVDDVRGAYGLLFSAADTQFSDFRSGFNKAKHDPRVRETEAKVRELLTAHQA